MPSPLEQPPSAPPAASVVVRAKNEARGIEAALRSLREQTVELEVIVVDSGSTDGTLELARRWADRLITLEPGTFTFGRSLNVGAAAASGDVVFALSAHCVAPDPGWAARSLRHYAHPGVAGTFGTDLGPTGEPLTGARTVTFGDVLANPHWGYSNHASSWRRSVWSEMPFSESARSCEDKEWMWRVLGRGLTVVADPSLHVGSRHRRQAGLRSLWRREVAEHAAVAELLDFPVPTLAETVRDWWSWFPWPSPRPAWQRRLSPWRTVELAGGYVGDRRGAAARGPQTMSLPPQPSY